MSKIPLDIKIRDYNAIHNNKFLMTKLRNLTLDSCSGMNTELNYLSREASLRKVKTKVVLAYHNKILIAWALLTKECSGYWFSNINGSFDPKLGVLFEVFVNPKYRRQGVASSLLEAAKTRVGNQKLCFAPWDPASRAFYDKFRHLNHMDI